jgi:hypothetical protein
MQGQVEPILMPQSTYIRWRCTLAEHLQNRVAGNEMNQQKDERNHQPDDGQSEDEAGENLLQGLGTKINQGPATR